MRFLIVVALLTGCSSEPTGGLGPSGIENRFRIFENGESYSVENVDLTARSSGDQVTLRFSGRNDPFKDALDDEESLDLTIGLDRELLFMAVTPADVRVDASTTDDQTRNNSGGDPMVRALSYRRACFCEPGIPGTQRFDGSLRLTGVASDEITGTADIQIGGIANGYGSTPIDVRIEAEFNLAIRVSSPIRRSP